MSPDHPGEIAGIIASVDRNGANSIAPGGSNVANSYKYQQQTPQQLNQPTQSTSSSSPITSASIPSSSNCTSSNSPSVTPPPTATTIPTTTAANSAANNFSPFSKILKRKPKGHKSVFSSLLCCFSRFNTHHHSQRNPPCSPPSNNNRLDPSVPIHPPGPAINDFYYEKQFQGKSLLPPVRIPDANKMCLVIDLDETLVHSSFKPITNPDFIVPVEIEGTIHQVYVLKRPYVDEFLQKMGELYECVLFTASLAKYADPVADLLDKWGVFRSRLFRESCVYYRGNYVKDLARLGRDLHKVIIVDNSPASYTFHPDNAVPVASWFDDMSDSELRDLVPFFEKLSKVDDIYTVLRSENSNSPQSQNQLTRGPNGNYD